MKKTNQPNKIQMKNDATIHQNERLANLRKQFFALSPLEQESVTIFFQLHNAAQWHFGHLSKEGQTYVNTAILATKEAAKLEKEAVQEKKSDK